MTAAKYSVTFIDHNGQSYHVEVAEGWSLMEAAVRNRIPGIDADCGGACACATCQVYVAPQWYDKLAPKSEMEETMLDFAPDPKPTSRLSCQLRMTSTLNGIILYLPKPQN